MCRNVPQKAMGLWKEGKTVPHPVSHCNNIISNISINTSLVSSMHRVDKFYRRNARL